MGITTLQNRENTSMNSIGIWELERKYRDNMYSEKMVIAVKYNTQAEESLELLSRWFHFQEGNKDKPNRQKNGEGSIDSIKCGNTK